MRPHYFILKVLFAILLAVNLYAQPFRPLSSDWFSGNGSAESFTLTHDIGLGANNPFLRLDESSGKWQFKNSSQPVKDLGSGSGSGGDGGINSLETFDPSFEEDISLIVTSGGTLSNPSYTNGTESNLKFARFVATSAGQYFETPLVNVSDLVGFGCMADLRYFQGDNAFDYKVLNSSGDTLSSGSLGDLNDGWLKAPTITLKCPDAGETYKLRVEAKAAGTIDVDLFYLGGNKNISPIGNSASFKGSIEWTPTSNCFWQSVAATPDSFPANSNCDDNPRILAGEAQDSSNGLQPRMQFSLLKKGHYVIKYQGSFGDTASNVNSIQTWKARLQDSLNTYDSTPTSSRHGGGSGVEGLNANLEFHINVEADMNNVDLNLLGGTSTTSDAATILTNTSMGLKISVFYYPSSGETQEALTPEQASFFVKGKIYETTGSNITGTQASTPNTWLDSELEMIINKGSAEMPCAGGEIPSGLTCSSNNEEVGIVVNFPRAGNYEVCFDSVLYSGGNHIVSQRIYMMDSITSSLFSQGTSGNQIHTAGGVNTYYAKNLCETFEISSVGKRKFLLFHEATNSDTQLRVGRNGSISEEDVSFTVKMINHFVSRPLVDNQVSTRSRAGVEKGVCIVDKQGTVPTFDSLDPDCWFIQSISNNTTGDSRMTLISADFKCTYSALLIERDIGTRTTGGSQITGPTFPQTFDIVTNVSASGANDNVSFSIACSRNK